MNVNPLGAPAPAVESLSITTYRQQPVVTTALLAQLYGTEPQYINKNHERNADRFVAGKHFIKLEGEALREFKRSLTVSKTVSEIPVRTRHLLLWTERGATRAPLRRTHQGTARHPAPADDLALPLCPRQLPDGAPGAGSVSMPAPQRDPRQSFPRSLHLHSQPPLEPATGQTAFPSSGPPGTGRRASFGGILQHSQGPGVPLAARGRRAWRAVRQPAGGQ